MSIDTAQSPVAGTTDAEVAARLCAILARLGGSGPSAAAHTQIRRLTTAAFPRPLGDPAYRTNALNPGGTPVEVSFSEQTPQALRFDLTRGHPDTALADRRTDALRLAEVPVSTARRWEPYFADDRFGGFISAVVDVDGQAAKAYLEVRRSREVLAALGSRSRVHESLLEAVPGLEPHFVALDGARFAAHPRMYYECRNGIALSTLVDWAAGHGLTRPALAAAHVTRRLTGRLILPEAGVLLALGTTSDSVELKLELTRGVLDGDPLAAIRAVLVERPHGEQAFRDWCAAVDQPVRPTMVSVRICADGPLLSVYAGLAP
ncbi:hypothetical protein [Micromonospora luteifusca]|uniref:hypothetical protein n=1 Tax=Micromonospora luteifusca TaxID=709860 RepID=UPI0033AF69BE